MHPHTEDVIIEDEAFYKLIHTAVDIVYTPSCTKFMKMVQAAGGKAINGLDMLLYQGLIAFELWNPEVKVDKDTIDRIREMILDHLHGNTRKHNVIFTGFMGAGKTSAGHFMQIIITCRSLIQIRRSKKKQVWLFPRSLRNRERKPSES